jgi:heme A synthase
VQRLAAIVLATCFAALGTGALRFAHDASHAYADARHPEGSGSVPQHDETNCDLHALLNAPLMHAGAVPLLVLLGLFVAFLTVLAPQPVSVRVLSRIDCRGPPSCAF